MEATNNTPTAIIEIRICKNGARAGKFWNADTQTHFWKFLSKAEIELMEGILDLRFRAGEFNVVDYVSQKGEITRRTISAYRYWKAGNGTPCVRAYCHKRQEDRTFNWNNIVEVVA